LTETCRIDGDTAEDLDDPTPTMSVAAVTTATTK